MNFSSTQSMGRERLPEALALFSLGLGAAEIAVSRQLARFAGLPDNQPALIKAMGMREVAAGAAILAQPLEPRWTWTRVVGDAIDLALMGVAFTSPRAKRDRLTASTIAVLGVTALDVFCARLLSRGHYRQVSRRHLSKMRGNRLQETIAVNCSPELVYQFWRDFTNWTRIMTNIRAIEPSGEKRLRWTANARANGRNLEWDAELIEDRPNELISWRTIGNGLIENAGSVRISQAPAGHGTMVRIEMLQRPAWVMRAVFGTDPTFHLRESLRRMKALLETGEIPTTIGQPSGRSARAVQVEAEVGHPMAMRALLAS
jgi:uncharacterized membrane protein